MKTFVAAFALSLAAGASAQGPTSMLYITNFAEFGTSSGLDMVQGGFINSISTNNPNDICIGVAGGDVRTFGYTETYAGSRFDLVGNPLAGGPYLNNAPITQYHDGTSDGRFNYSLDYTNGNVVRFDRNWGSPTVLFNCWGSMPAAGHITLDATDGSFWISEWGGPDRVEHRTSAGVLLSSFNSGIAGSAGLALDPVDGTLWMGGPGNLLHQFNQSGTYLQTMATGLGGAFYGMEFETSPVPEPASFLALLGGICFFKRRKR